MDQNKKTMQSRSGASNQVAFWGTLGQSALLILLAAVVAYLLLTGMTSAPATGFSATAFIYIVMAAVVVLAGLNIASLVYLFRGRQDRAFSLTYSSMVFFMLAITSLIQGRAPYIALFVLVVTAVGIGWLCPPELKRRYIVSIAIALVLMGLIEWANPPWRTAYSGTQVAPTAAVIFALFMGLVAMREAWSRNNIRSRFLTLSLGLTLIGTLIVAAISVNSFLSAGKQQQEIASDVLRDQIRNTLRHQTVEVAIKNDVILNSISQDAQDVAQQAEFIFENPGAFTSETFWKADDHMFRGPQGQYMNSANDVSTIFVPSTVPVDEGLKQQLEQLAYLDMALVPAFEDNPNATAIYFVGKDEVSWLYPNINLGTIVPPDYLATQDIFYTTGSPANNPGREVVWTPVYDDPGGQGLLVSAIAPVYVKDTFMGIIGIDVSLASLTESIETEDFGAGEGVYALLLDNQGKALALPEQGYRDILGREPEAGEFGADLAHSARPEFKFILDFVRSGETGIQSVFIGDRELFVGFAPLATTPWHIVSVADTQQVLAPAAKMETTFQELTNSLVYQQITPVGIVLIILVIVVGIFFTNRLVKPIEQLTEDASKIGSGQWDTSLPEGGLVEIDKLSITLRDMARQLKGTLESLEQRVADRTHNLELAAEVGRAVSEVRDLDVMLKDACDLILKEFDLYYVQVYLTDPRETKLLLEAGTGSVGAQLLGRGHNLPFDGNSINGRAAVEKRSVVISDTAESATFRQNPLLPDTRGEMAVPLIVANKVVGVLDMQSREPGVLNREVLPAFEALAGQLAVAIQNANLLAETKEARAEVEKQARRLVRTGWNEHLDAIHKPEKLGFIFSQNEVTALVDSDESQVLMDSKAVSAPIAITGEPLGSLVVEIDDESRRDQTAELVNVVARQVAQQIENLRLLESSERYRYEAEEASRRITIEGWKSYMERAGENLGYLYDLNEVRPQNSGNEQVDASSYTLPVKVRDETIGKLVVQGLEESDEQSMNIANAVVERLGAHIESLRQFEETQRGQLELDKRARQLAAVAEVSSVSARELDIQKMLASVVHLTQRKFGLYHAHVFTYTEQTEMLKIMACGWKEGDEHEGTHGTTAIPLDQELSLVALAARLRQPVISNDVHHEAGWLPNPLLPDTQAEMAVPLLIGDKILGVLDVQSDKLNAFSQEDASIFTTLAAQIATALQNAQSFVQAQKQAERESRLNVISQKIQSATTVEAVLQIAARELGHTLGAPLTIAQLGLKETPNDN